MGKGLPWWYFCVLWEQPCCRAILAASPCPGMELRRSSVLLGCPHPTGFVVLPLPFRAFPNIFHQPWKELCPQRDERRAELGGCRAQLGKLWGSEPCWPPHGPSQPYYPCLTAELGVTVSKKTRPSLAGLEPEECF